MPIESVPSPFQSPASGRIPAPPGPNMNMMSAEPVVFVLRRKKAPVAGS